jgi:arylsulfatase A
MNKTITLLPVSFLVLISCYEQQKQINQQQKQNIIYIMADDLGYGDLSCYGQKKFSTPNIDKLAENGLKFTQHYSGSTVCAPSRSSLMTGQHTGHTFIRENKEVQPEGQFPLKAEIYTLAEALQEIGYVTGAFVKWGLGYPGSEGDPNNQGFDEFFGYNCQRIAHYYYPYHVWRNQEKIMLKRNESYQTEQYGPDVIHRQALNFLDENKEKPFFMFYSSLIPHAIPMIAVWEGKIAPGTETDHPSAFWDVFPTVVEITGATKPEKIDGISFLATLLGNNDIQEKHEFLYWEFHELGGRKALRKGDWKVVFLAIKQTIKKNTKITYSYIDNKGILK